MIKESINPLNIENLLNYNKARVLREIWLKDGISRIEISKKLSLDKSTITKIVNQLISNEFIITTTTGNTGPYGGRKPISLSINTKKGSFLGIELRTEKCIALLIDPHGSIIREIEESYESDTIDSIIKSIKKVIIGLKDNPPLSAIGIGVSGIIDHNRGIILKSFPLSIAEHFHIKKEISSFTDCPIVIDNDANCGCWGELVNSKNQRHSNMLYLAGELNRKKSLDGSEIGAGIGLGILINGKVLHGSGFSAGEFRSVFLEKKQKNQFISQSTPQVIEELAKNIAMIINTFNITEVILGGTLYKHGDGLIAVIREKTDLNWAYEGSVDCSIRFSKYQEKDVAYGAAGMCLEQYFSV